MKWNMTRCNVNICALATQFASDCRGRGTSVRRIQYVLRYNIGSAIHLIFKLSTCALILIIRHLFTYLNNFCLLAHYLIESSSWLSICILCFFKDPFHFADRNIYSSRHICLCIVFYFNCNLRVEARTSSARVRLTYKHIYTSFKEI